MKVAYIQDQEIYQYGEDYYHAKSAQFFTRYLAGLTEAETLTVCCGIIKVKRADEVANYQKITNPRILYKRMPDFRKFSSLKEIINVIKKQLKEFDFYYLRMGIAASIASYYCNKNKVSYMAIVNEDIYKNCIVSSKAIVRFSAFPLWIGARYAIKHAKYACYVTKDYLQKKYPTRGKKIGCSDVETLELQEDILERRIQKIESYDSRVCVIGIAGAVNAYLKAHDVAIKAIKMLNENSTTKYVLEIVGGGSLQRLLELVCSEKIEDQVFFLGEKSHEDVIKWMDHLDIYVHPSRSEGLPRTIIEAISRATPCICSNVGGIPELIDGQYLFSYKDGMPEKKLANLVACMNKEEMRRQAIQNFKKAQEYAPKMLEKKRNSFFKNAISAER